MYDKEMDPFYASNTIHPWWIGSKNSDSQSIATISKQHAEVTF